MAGGEAATIYRDATGRIVRVIIPDLSVDYAPASGSSVYETQAHAAATYETQAHAAATYETQAALATYLNPPRCSMTQNTHHDSHTSGSWIVVTWTEADDYDTNNMHDTTTNTGRATANTAGLYHATFTVSWNSGSTAARGICLRKNSGGVITGGTLISENLGLAGSAGTVMNLCGEVYLNVNDYIEFFAFQNNGTTLTTNVCTAQVRWVAP